jgi:dihydrofolate reductase
MPVFKMIAAVAFGNLAVGQQGKIPWRIKEDLQHFKRLTLHTCVVMGRKTFESLGSKPLPERTNVVLSTQPRPADLNPAVVWLNSYDAVLEYTKDEKLVWIIGGGEIYELFLPIAQELVLTWVLQHVPEADAYFPNVEFTNYTLKREELTSAPIQSWIITYTKKESTE